MRKTASYEPSRVKIGSVVFVVGDDKNKKGKERYKKSQSRYISRSRREAPCERILTKFRTLKDIADVIICAKFDVGLKLMSRKVLPSDFTFEKSKMAATTF